MQND